MHSALYIGRIRHRRFTPRFHHFVYLLPFFYLDLSEVRQIFRRKFLMTTRGPSILAFRRRDYLGDPAVDLATCVREVVEAKTGHRPCGPIRVLTQLSYFGFCFNPISLYYCFRDDQTEIPEFVVAQVTNTPWRQTHVYVVQNEDALSSDSETLLKGEVLSPSSRAKQSPDLKRFKVPKDFHVSPFMPMLMNYHWSLKGPGRTISVRMENRAAGEPRPIFEATMALKRVRLSAVSIVKVLLRFPLLTMRPYIAIYWQALQLFVKGVPYIPHPSPGGA